MADDSLLDLDILNSDCNDKFVIQNLLSGCDFNGEASLWSDDKQPLLDEIDLADQKACNNLLNDCFRESESSLPPVHLTPPDTPPSSDRSTPPNVEDFTSANNNTLYPSTFGTSQNGFCDYPLSPQSIGSPSPSVIADQSSFSRHLQSFTTATTRVAPFPYQPQSPCAIAPHNSRHQVGLISSCVIGPGGIRPLPVLHTPVTSAPVVAKKRLTEDEKKREMSIALKEARKLRNREAASNSRQKQKEHLDSLENKCKSLEQENKSLKNENSLLKSKISFLEREAIRVKDTFHSSLSGSSSSSKRKALSLLAVVFILGVNLGPFAGVFVNLSQDKAAKSLTSPPASHSGRVLLWTEERDLVGDKLLGAEKILQKREAGLRGDFNLTDSADCQQFINKTESMRLENELRGFVERVESEKLIKKKKPRKAAKAIPKKPIPLQRMKSWLNYQDQTGDNVKELELFDRKMDKLPFTYQNLLDAIHRRDDTFYFVAFSAGDALLLPAEANKTKVRPRFSVIMPALSTFNETMPGTGVNSTYSVFTLMQIDCEVMNTKIVQMRNLLPERADVRPEKNVSISGKQRSNTKRESAHSKRNSTGT